MHTKRILPLLFSSFMLVNCSGGRDGFEVEGNFEGGAQGKLLLEELTSGGRVPVDSCTSTSNGSFKLSGAIETPGFYALSISGNPNTIMLAIHPGEELRIDARMSESHLEYLVEGSEDSRLIKELNEKQQDVLRKIQALGKTYNDSLGSANILSLKSNLDSSFRELLSDQYNWSKDFVKQNAKSLAGLMALYQQVPSDNPTRLAYVLDPTNDFDLYWLVDSCLNKLYPTSDPVKTLHAQTLVMFEKNREENRIRKVTGRGAYPPDIRLPSPRKDTLSLHALRGRYVLLVFWASFDQASRLTNKTIYSLYYNYHWKGLDVFQVSLDRSRDAWVNAIAADGMIWNQVSDLRFWNSPLVSLFNIRELPAVYLLNKEGAVIATDLHGEEIKLAVESVFARKIARPTTAPSTPASADSLGNKPVGSNTP